MVIGSARDEAAGELCGASARDEDPEAPGRAIDDRRVDLATRPRLERTRDEAIDRLARLGARVAGRVSRKTDYVVVGDRPGGKLAAARRLGIPILGEREFLALTRRRAT